MIMSNNYVYKLIDVFKLIDFYYFSILNEKVENKRILVY